MDLRNFIDLDEDEERSEVKEIRRVTLGSPEYPYLLSKIDERPEVLYAKGNVNLLQEPAVAIVGTRELSEEGETYARKIAEFYARQGFVIVSGLAIGVDTVAMKSALKSGGRVIAVLPTLGKIVPESNEELACKILDREGLLISESISRSLKKYMFVYRNRIISGISLGVIVVETDIRGGTMHTVDYAKKQKKLIIVADIPAEGNKKLIEEGYPVFRL
ncbi:DNA processing protein DprA [Archaeoglobales archaeon]|nr:MAG: DNA processing protein DprA [Archaeoglobales archaeon]